MVYNNALKKIYDGDKLAGMEEIAKTFNIKNYDDDVINLLYDVFLSPNLQTFNENYIKNVKLLNEYPYIFNKNFLALEDNTFLLFPIDENIFFEYNRFSCTFEKVEVNSYRETKYFFEFLDNPLLVENEFNEFNLNFLVDNVRASEDVAYENHIYLYYDNIRVFTKLLCYCNFESLLKDKKIVFLFDREKSMYPIDFKQKFDIDYSSMEFQEVRPSEVKRLIVQTHMFSSAANGFREEIFDWHPKLLTMSLGEAGFGIYNRNMSLEKYISIVQDLINNNELDKIEDKLTAFTMIRLGFKGNELDFIGYFDVFKEICLEYEICNRREWLVASYLAYSRYYKKEEISRIVPAIHHMLHFVATENNEFNTSKDLGGSHSEVFYSECLGLYEEFPYFYSHCPVRDPVSSCVANVKLQLTTLFKNVFFYNFITWWFVDFDFENHYHKSVSHRYKERMLIRLEDLKMNPKATLVSFCKFINIPYDISLENGTSCGKELYNVDNIGHANIIVYSGTKIASNFKSAYSVFSLYEDNNNEYLSDFDIKRLEMAFYPGYETMGYKPQEYDYVEYTDQEIIEMFEKPFKYEKMILKRYPENQQFHLKTAKGIVTLNAVQYNSVCRKQLAEIFIRYRKSIRYKKENNMFKVSPILIPDERFLVNDLYTNSKALPNIDDIYMSFFID